jgi:hypothetical protein
MRKLLSVFLLAAGALHPSATQALEMDADTELLIRCGSSYMVMADNDETLSAEDSEILRTVGLGLLEQADAALAAQGVDGDAREKAGAELATEVINALAAKTDPGFETAQCTALVNAWVEAQADSGAGPVETANEEEIDKLMTCGAGFYVTAESAKEEGDDDTARNLGALAETLIGRAEALMIEDGMDDAARFELSKEYGQRVAAQIYAGEELAYDWDTCANLAY